MTWLVASVAVATSIPPQFLMEDGHMLKAMVAVLHERDKQNRRGSKA
jgi:hypothetical protein